MRTRLMRPFLWMVRNRFFPSGQLPARTLLLLGFGLGVTVAIYLVTAQVVGYFHRQNELGVILSLKIFQMAWITLFAMLIFSCMVSSVSALFLSRDNEILYGAPVSPAELYFLRYWTVTFYTAWMMVIFSVPVFAAFGSVFKAGLPYWPLMFLAVLATALIATGLGLLLTIVLVNLFPARQTKDIVMYLSLCFGLLMVLVFRLLRPEELANPEKYGQFFDYLSTIATPAGPYLPAAWAANLLSLYLLDREIDWLLVGLLTLTPVAVYLLGEWAMEGYFFSGYSKAQESFGGYRRFFSRHPYRLQPAAWWIYKKEARSFYRDSTEWSQLFMVGALIVVYLYNFKVLPLDRSFMKEEYLANLFAFLNIGLTGFVVTSLSARFVYPAVGTEGESFYLLRSSPMTMRRFLFHKYLFYLVPFIGLSLLLVVVSCRLLHVEGPVWWLSVVVSTIIAKVVVAMALGFGSRYADFKAENKAAALGGMGAILFLFSSLTFQVAVLASGAWPVYHLAAAWLQGRPAETAALCWLLFWLVGLGAASAWLVRFSLRQAESKLEALG